MTGAVSSASSGSSLHVFVDANIFLSFFHFTKSNLDALREVFASHDDGVATVYLTQQVRDEIDRNREHKIKDAMKMFRDLSFAKSFPNFIQNYPEAQQINDLLKNLATTHKQLLTNVDTDIKTNDLLADRLLKDIFADGGILPRRDDIEEMAKQRMRIGNPPGKKGSIGDAINWLTLLKKVPDREDLHLISEDSDFFSSFDRRTANPFLSNEWKETKKSSLYVYWGLESFMKEHFDGTDFSIVLKRQLIERLKHSGTFATTHKIVAELATFSYYSQGEVLHVLDAAVQNNQVHWIAADPDVADFLNRITSPYLHEITDPEHMGILEEAGVIPKQQEVDAESDEDDPSNDIPF